eukprot:SAG31_NODE_3693_length_3983_cov_2.012358_5_plen_115_part_00
MRVPGPGLMLGLVLAFAGLASCGANAVPHRDDAPAASQQTRARDCADRSADDVARSAADVCGGLPAEEALRTVTLMAPPAARRAAELLAELGFRTALDLELLGGGRRRRRCWRS